MSRKSNPALLGAFIVGAAAVAVAALVVFGGGKIFRHTQRWVAYFDESIKGLAVGAPVTFRGVKVGSVTSIHVFVDREAQDIRIPVVFEIEADRVTQSGGGEVQFASDRAGARLGFDRGLRAQLELQSFVTGQLSINLDIHPGAQMKLRGGSSPYPEFPTIPSSMSELGQSLDELDLAEMAQDLRRAVKGIDHLINSPEAQQILVSASAALEGANKLVVTADAKVASLGAALEKSSTALNETLATIRTLALHVDDQTVPAATQAFKDAGQVARRVDNETVPAANQLLGDTRQLARHLDAETVPAVTQVLADVRPLVREIIQTVEAARAALEQAQRTLGTAEQAVEDRSPLQFQIRSTLQEVSGAARAIRSLSNYLERHPEAVLFGKGEK